MAEVALLAVTRMISGICIGGVPPGGGAWVRPVKKFGTILPGDIRYLDGNWMRPFDVIDINLIRPRPDPPHVEDWTCDFVRPRPRLVRRLDPSDRRRLLQSAMDPAAAEAWRTRRQSLAVIRPGDITAHFALDAYSSHYESRIAWPGCERTRGCPVTDLRWRALGRRLVPREGGELRLSLEDLVERIGCEEVFLAVGLSRNYEGQFWPIVVGVHCLPDFEVTLDPANL
jgi:hypothetical protein